MSAQKRLAKILRDGDVKVREVKGWQTRGHGTTLNPVGILLHHTAGHAPGDRSVVTRGRSDLPGPLCNLYLDPDGTWYVVAAGVAYHAGAGSRKVIEEIRKGEPSKGDARDRKLRDDYTSGNSDLIGIEVSHIGTHGRYPKAQITSLVQGLAALCEAYGWSEKHIRMHREWTARKVDMSYRGVIRGRVEKQLTASKRCPRDCPCRCHKN